LKSGVSSKSPRALADGLILFFNTLKKNPVAQATGFFRFRGLTSARGSRQGNPFSSLRFALLAPPEFARLLVALFQLQALEETVILNLFLQNAHCFFNIVVKDFDFDFFHSHRPFRAAGHDAMPSSQRIVSWFSNGALI
jgi:hypothetical protein